MSKWVIGWEIVWTDWVNECTSTEWMKISEWTNEGLREWMSKSVNE